MKNVKDSYELIVGKGLKLVPLSSLPVPDNPDLPIKNHIKNVEYPSEVASVYVAMDLVPLDDSVPTSQIEKPPDVLCLEQLNGKNISNISGNPGAICAITENKEFLMANTIITEDRNGNVQFSSQGSFDLFEALNVDCGAEHTIVIAVQGHQYIVLGCGNNQYGQLGIGNIEYSPKFKPIKFPTPQRFIQVCCGMYFTALLSDLSEVWVFGYNNHGQLGIDGDNIIKTPKLCAGLTGVPVCCLAAGSNHTLALTSTGVVFGAGSNSQGQIGISSTKDISQFTIIDALSNVFIVFITAHSTTSAAIDEFGSLYLWGDRFGPSPSALTLNSRTRERFVDVALGNDGRFAALTDTSKLFVSGYYLENGQQMPIPVQVTCPVLPFYRVFSGGEYFMVLAGPNKPLPLVSMKTQSSLPPPTPRCAVTEKLRSPPKIMSFTAESAREVITSPVAGQLLRYVFSSVGSLNASFLVDNFSETMSDISSGIDVAGVISTFELLYKRKELLNIVTTSFNRMLISIIDNPLVIRRPTTIRFIIIGLLMPSTLIFREGYDFWRHLIMVIKDYNISSILAQWLSFIQPDHMRRILYSLKDLLGRMAEDTGRLYTPAITATVSVIESVWFASTRSRKLVFEEFYHDKINQMIDISIEYNLYNMGGDNWCYCTKAPWLLNADTKTRFVRLCSKQIQNQRQFNAISRAQQVYGTTNCVTPMDLFLLIQVDRNNIIRDTFLQISLLKHPEIDLKKPLKVIFKDEPGVDEGGVQREFFDLIISELFDPEKGFFIRTENFNWFNPDAKDPASQQAYLLAGMIFGLALYNGNLLNVKFPTVIYKKLRGLSTNLNDLNEFDPQVMVTLNNVLTYEGDVENDMCLSFEYNGVPLIENGENIPVTKANREQYVDAVAHYILTTSIITQFDAFKTGFLEAAGTIVLDLFRPEEIALLVAGREDLDYVSLQKVARYEGYTDQSESVRIFWKIVHNRLNDSEKRKLLYFFTSSPRAPINGLESIPFVIVRDPDTNHIPTSHTCFFVLVLPDYKDEGIMLQKLKIAIENAEGFAFK